MEISLSRAGCRSLSFAFGVMAVARDFHRAGRIVAVVAAILLAFINQAVARRVGAFLFLLGHDSCLLLVHGFFVGRRVVGENLALTEDHTPASVAVQPQPSD